MSYAKSLRNALYDKNKALYNRLPPIEDASRSVLTYTASKFPYYTPHDFRHSLNVEENLNWLVPDEIKSKMNDHEIFFLIVSAWLHDWGMVASQSENAEEVRAKHHIRTEENFEKFYDKIHLNHQEARIVGRICKGHRNDDLQSPEYKDSFIGSNISIRIPFLASLVRLADECDVTANRTPEIIYYSLKPEGASEAEFQKHLSIIGIGQPTPYKIVLSGVAYTPQGADVIKGVKKKIQQQLDSVKTILATNGIILDIVEHQIDTRGFIDKPIAFELDRKSIVDLLIGHALYSRDDVAIRELLQNSIDTCRYRKAIDNSYQPNIMIEFDREHITFKDNGMGMCFEDAYEYFSKKGSSFYVPKNLDDTLRGKKFDPISKFGIGVLSSFLIANKMIVSTKKENCASCRFSINDLAEGWTYEEGARQEPGTEITIFFNDKGKILDILQSLHHYAKNVEIPITIKNLESGEAQIYQQKWDYDIPEVIAKISRLDEDRSSLTEPKLKLICNSRDLEITFYIFKKSLFESENCFIINHGIYIGNFNLFPSHSDNWIALINLKSNLVDLTVSRDDLVRDDKFKQFLEILYKNLLDVISRTIEEKHVSSTEMEKCVGFSQYLNLFFRDRFGSDIEDPRSAFLPKLTMLRKYPVLTKEGFSILPGDTIIKSGKSKIFHYNLPIDFFDENIAIIRHIVTPNMNDDEAVVFDFGPCLQYIKSPRKFECSFCESLHSLGINSVKCHELATLLPKGKFSKKNTGLDPLLPPGSYFSSMPENLRSVVAQIKPFEFSPHLETLVPSNSQEKSLYHLLVAERYSLMILSYLNSMILPFRRGKKKISKLFLPDILYMMLTINS